MAVQIAEKNDTFELARELLIAISSSAPDKPLKARSAYKSLKPFHGIAVNKKVGTKEKLRSNLISISSIPEVGAQEA